MRITPKKNTRTYVIVAAVVVLLVVGGVFAYKHYSDSNTTVSRDKSGTSLERSQEELDETNSIQDNPEDSKQQTGSDAVTEPAVDSSTGKRSVNVVLTSTGTENGEVDASGFVSNLVEEGGTCTFTFAQNQKIIKKTSTTATNPTSTTCLTVRFDEKELGSGEWKVVIQYASSNASGSSNEGTLVIR